MFLLFQFISTTFLSRKTVKTDRVRKFIYLNKEFLYHQSEQKFGFSMLFCFITMNLEVKMMKIRTHLFKCLGDKITTFY